MFFLIASNTPGFIFKTRELKIGCFPRGLGGFRDIISVSFLPFSRHAKEGRNNSRLFTVFSHCQNSTAIDLLVS